MADIEIMNYTPIQKNSKILVNVDESLPDILVVTYEYGSKIFQGVLLDSTKRNLPYGVSSLHPAYSNDKPEVEDRLYSANQRFTYQDGVSAKEFTQKRSVRLPARYKNAKMTVRLRPRQVLCSKCRGICNENSENVDASKKRKATDEEVGDKQQKRIAMVSTRNSKPLSSDTLSNEQVYQQQQRMCLRLAATTEISTDSVTNSELSSDNFSNQQEHFKSNLTINQTARKEGTTSKSEKKRMVLRKKRSVGSMEDLWDESVFEENAKNAGKTDGMADNGSGNVPGNVHSTRTIRISFGREGEGTVLKIPANIEGLDTSNIKEDDEECENDVEDDQIDEQKIRTKDAKAARRALKKAKKEARRKILLGSGGSPCYAMGSTSPRYALGGGSSPRCPLGASGTSPRHLSTGGLSPRHLAPTTITNNADTLITRRHKHKVKHKKKHREDKKRDTSHLEPTSLTTATITNTKPPVLRLVTSLTTSPLHNQEPDTVIDMKERCLKQKLSINLKRLNASAYTTRLETTTLQPSVVNAISVIVNNSNGSSSSNGNELLVDDRDNSIQGNNKDVTLDEIEGSECSDEQAPDFPVHAHSSDVTQGEDEVEGHQQQPLMMRLTAQAVRESLGADGRKLGVGDVVWGKIHGFPWWPGKVLSIQQVGGTGNLSSAQAHVAWYGSSTSSLMPCEQLSPFLENFKIRYNKKKRGPYKEAIKQATCEARTELPKSPPLAAMSPLARPALASPREIDVVS